MPAYVLVQITVTDSVKYEDYKKAAPPAIARYGGKYLVRGGDVEVLEGAYSGRRMVILEFPNMEAARAFWNSPEYGEARKVREGAAIMDAWAVPGVE